jgi:hypothetical protein
VAGDGGAISNGDPYVATGTMTLDQSSLTHNQANLEGGGIENWGALTVSNSSIVGNQVGFLTGGGIENWGALTIINSTITGNTNKYGWPDNLSGNPPVYQRSSRRRPVPGDGHRGRPRPDDRTR